jgi:fluoroquinolone resistance protein
LSKIISSGSQYADQVFSGQNLDGLQIISSDFVECTFNHCTFIETQLQKCRFVNCAFNSCDLSLGKLPESIFIETSFHESKIIGVNWAQAGWPATGLGVPINFSKSTLNHSTFIGLKLQGIQIISCQAVNVDFREADLSNADFSGSDLSESLFIHTNLSGADFSQARNYMIDPGLNELKKAKFSLPEAMALLYNMDITLTGEYKEDWTNRPPW